MNNEKSLSIYQNQSKGIEIFLNFIKFLTASQDLCIFQHYVIFCYVALEKMYSNFLSLLNPKNALPDVFESNKINEF